MIALDHLQVDLSGMHLIEASAGTGKTYAIALLYVRLLVELNLEPKQILVVTYTEAATKELRGRIRRRIREALDVIDGGDTDDHLLRSLCSDGNGRWGDKRAIRASLDRALKSFDTAAIFTIHGFCLRALKENAFESGSRYDTELVTDPTPLLGEVVDDFWRQAFFNDSAQLLGHALHKRYSPDSLRHFVKELTTNSRLRIVPEFSPGQVTALAADCSSLFSRLKQEWPASRQELVVLIGSDKGLKRSADAFKETLLPGYFAQLDSYAGGDNPYDLPADFALFTSSGIARGTKPSGSSPHHPFFALCESLQQLVAERMLLFCGELLIYCNEQLPLRKEQKNIRFFDDLLNDLDRALNAASGALFAARLRDCYQAALIDEFQDTDPVQYDIFRKIYAGCAAPLFLIGDPKQAIYSFRGADIFAYLQAATDVAPEKRLTLTSNWRSTPELLAAFNLIFKSDRKPFIYEQIEYHPLASGTAVARQLNDAAGVSAPLQIMLLPGDGITVTRANELIPGHVAAEIARLLAEGAAGRARIGDQPVVPADIAVIVRSHRQAAAIRDALTPLGVPCVLRSDMTIFASDEAREVCTLLQGLLNPGSETRVRAALVTDILGRSGSDIAALLDDEHAWERCLDRFRDYHQTWHDKGFMVMSRLLMEREGVRGRLLRFADGERRLTNLLHCFEVIHGKAHERGGGMEGLVTWFSERVCGGDKSEEHEIRLETDEKAVKILTIHVAKGLEYPLVFCPYLWTGIRESAAIVSCHEGFSLVKDYGSADYERHARLAEKEQLAESLRLLYVAVTRAKYRCYLYGGKVTGKKHKSRPETSPLAYLFHASNDTRQAQELVARLAAEYSGLSAERLEEQLQQLAADSAGTLAVAPLAAESTAAGWQLPRDETAAFKSRTFSGTIRSDWRVTSFTAFAAHETRGVELPDRDETVLESAGTTPAAEPSAGGMTAFTFPRGAAAGIFMHALFEELDFPAASAATIADLVAAKLELHGYNAAWQPAITGMVMNVIQTPLPSPAGAFTLAQLQPGRWLPELEFFFPLRFVSSEQLRLALHGFSEDYRALDLTAVLAALQFRPVRGMVRGFMDMVFEHAGRYYLVDWKSNHLGFRSEDYGQEAMQREMVRNLYPLQYLLYTVALNNYLALRVKDYDYDRHFGGVYYLFIRGMSGRQGGDGGIFRDLPPAKLVQSLTQLLVETGGRAAP